MPLRGRPHRDSLRCDQLISGRHLLPAERRFRLRGFLGLVRVLVFFVCSFCIISLLCCFLLFSSSCSCFFSLSELSLLFVSCSCGCCFLLFSSSCFFFFSLCFIYLLCFLFLWLLVFVVWFFLSLFFSLSLNYLFS